VSSVVLSPGAAIGVAAGVTAVLTWSWFYLPLVAFESKG
jgi:hypothetical protein